MSRRSDLTEIRELKLDDAFFCEDEYDSNNDDDLLAKEVAMLSTPDFKESSRQASRLRRREDYQASQASPAVAVSKALSDPAKTSSCCDLINKLMPATDKNSVGKKITVTAVPDFAVARGVIRALRSSHNSNRNYKQNAAQDQFLILSVEHFDRIISAQQQVVSENNNNRIAHAQREERALRALEAAAGAGTPPPLDVSLLPSSDEEEGGEQEAEGYDAGANARRSSNLAKVGGRVSQSATICIL